MNYSEIVLPSNKKFGLLFTTVFSLLGTYFYLLDKTNIYLIFFNLALLFLLLSIFKPNILKPLNQLWMFLGFIIGKVISPLVLGVIFFGIFTPISIFMKCFGRDELRLKLVSRKSHWKRVNLGRSHVESFKNQF